MTGKYNKFIISILVLLNLIFSISYIKAFEKNAIKDEDTLNDLSEENIEYGSGKVDGVLWQGDLLHENNQLAYYTLDDYDHSYDDKILNALENFQPSVYVGYSGITTDNVFQIFMEILNANPQLFYVDCFIQYSCNSITREVYNIMFRYNMTEDNVQSVKKQIKESIEDVYCFVDRETMSDEEIILAIHDYLAITIEYPYDDYKENKLVANDYNIYGALVLKRAVCQGYAEAFLYLLNLFEIPCGIVSSKNANHAWNVVLINDSWYHLDVTFDDPVYNRVGRVRHDY